MTWLSLALHVFIGFPLGLVVGNFGEWVIHKRLLHERGKRKGSFWNFHWYDHHAESRKNDMIDTAYHTRWYRAGWNPRTKEIASLAIGIPFYVALLFVLPGVGAAFLYTTFNYYYVHKRSHVDPAWARRKLPWHVDHHLAPNQDANWGVTWPWADWVLGTREYYVGTEREAQDLARAAERKARRDNSAAA